ncbi:MAG: MFS transporter [bacterium]
MNAAGLRSRPTERKLYGRLGSPYVWAGTTYFAEGLPFSLVRQISSVYFKDLGASLPAIGLTSLYGLPWTLKWLWAPFLDRFGTKRKWLLIAQALLVLAVSSLAAVSATPSALAGGAVVFLVIALFSATHDVATDGYYLEALDKQGQARFVGYRVMAYRLAMIAGAGGIVALSYYVGWSLAVAGAAAILAALLLYHSFFLPRAEQEIRPIRAMVNGRTALQLALAALAVAAVGLLVVAAKRWPPLAERLAGLAPLGKALSPAGWISVGLLTVLLVLLILRRPLQKRMLSSGSFYASAFMSFLDQDRIGWALAFIVFYRTGESLLGTMAAPFLLDLGIDKAQYGLLSGTLGIIFSIFGALAGGALIARHGLARTIWPFTLAQNLTNLLYMGLAFHYREILAQGVASAPAVSLGLVGAVHCFEQFAGGLGTSVFSYYLMRCCRPEFKASHFAIVSGVMTVGGTLFGVASGFLASWLGYGNFFGLSFLAALPGMCLIPFVPFVKNAVPPRA